MIITIPKKTLTINHLHGHHGFRWYLKPEGKKLQKYISEIVLLKPHSEIEGLIDKQLKVSIEIYENWYCKDKSVKRKDLDNRGKFLCDCIFNSLGIDDKFIFEHNMKKVQSNEEKAIIEIEEF